VSSAQVICVQQMSPPKLFDHQRSSKLVNAERLTLAIHTTDVSLPEMREVISLASGARARYARA